MVDRTTISHYEILDELGRGGMGVVYRARDKKLKREVALKVLPPDAITEPQLKRRFVQEARSAAALTHPNIAVVYEIDEADDWTFIAMELVQGIRLRDVVHGRPLSMDRALRIAVEIAQALEHAHKKGIVHRDLKPGNVMITDDGHAKIIDFGLAKLMEPLFQTGGDDITQAPEETESGVLVGTLSYMSPEQARGERIDHRTDIFSFGAILYEMLTGSSLFRRDKAVDTLAAVLREPTPRLEDSHPDRARSAPELQQIMDRCLAKSADERYDSMRAILSDLDSAASSSEHELTRSDTARPKDDDPTRAGATGTNVRTLLDESFVQEDTTRRPRRRRSGAWIAALALAALGTLWLSLRTTDNLDVGSDEPPLVAVGPFENLSGQQDIDWLEDGVSNLVRDNLAQSRQLVAVSKPRWDSIRRAAPDEEALHQAAAEAGIDFIVSGELLPSPDGLVLTARLTNLETGTDDFAYSFSDLAPDQVLARADGIASLAKQGVGVPPEETVDSFAADVAVDNIAAYSAYISGLEFFRRFDYPEAESSFAAALELEPDFAIVRYRLAHLYAVMGRRELAQSTIDEVPSDARLTRREQLYIDAARALFRGDYDAAIESYQLLLHEFPYDVEGRQFLAESYFLNYQNEEAIHELELLSAQEPENEFVWSTLGAYLILIGRPEDARVPLTRYLSLAPDDPNPYTLLGDLEQQLGNHEAAETHFKDALDRDAAFSLAHVGLSETLAVMGRFDEAETICRELLANSEIEPEDRITAAFDLTYILRAQYRFAESLVPLESVRAELAEEGIRESLALITRAYSAMELDRYDDAARWIDEAIARSAAAPTRYWFARAMLELHRNEPERALATAQTIGSYERPHAVRGETEKRAGLYVEALALLKQGELETARARFEESARLSGYPYDIYDAGLATALFEAGELDGAAEAAERAVAFSDPAEVRLDLELNRARAQLLLARILADAGDADRARTAARTYLSRWGRGNVEHSDLRLARSIEAAQSTP